GMFVVAKGGEKRTHWARNIFTDEKGGLGSVDQFARQPVIIYKIERNLGSIDLRQPVYHTFNGIELKGPALFGDIFCRVLFVHNRHTAVVANIGAIIYWLRTYFAGTKDYHQ